eukprot:74227-Rhodomonas_salina.1
MLCATVRERVSTRRCFAQRFAMPLIPSGETHVERSRRGSKRAHPRQQLSSSKNEKPTIMI